MSLSKVSGTNSQRCHFKSEPNLRIAKPLLPPSFRFSSAHAPRQPQLESTFFSQLVYHRITSLTWFVSLTTKQSSAATTYLVKTKQKKERNLLVISHTPSHCLSRLPSHTKVTHNSSILPPQKQTNMSFRIVFKSPQQLQPVNPRQAFSPTISADLRGSTSKRVCLSSKVALGNGCTSSKLPSPRASTSTST